jgi:hypothetical protein
MNKEPTQEQIKKFWEWCGFYRDEQKWWYKPDGNLWGFFTAPSLDLNNLFKYAVPKLSILRFSYIPETVPELYRWETMKPIQSYLTVIEGDNPALALFWAIYQVMEEQDNG